MEKPARTNKKSILIAAIVLVVAIAMFAWIYLSSHPAISMGEKSFTLIVVHGDKSEVTIPLQSDEEYLGPALKSMNLIAGSESELGMYVETVHDETADVALQQWWCLTQNGETLYTGVDTTPIVHNAQYELTLTTGW
ncbi:hypothetical protein LJC07_03445 [Christensenellaceae bacterium OttesenSCG-928-L17]|nr:hypothetical protein [Christensenellaceae bacterium OttesenSCG-928-L17]